jgi:hypothetical protein
MLTEGRRAWHDPEHDRLPRTTRSPPPDPAPGAEPVGTLRYDGREIEFGDRLLTHLQVVIIQKFRKGEAFAMSWSRSLALGSGRCSVWMVPSLPVVFSFTSARVPAIDREWLHALSESAGGPHGLVVVNEDGSLAQEGPVSRAAAVARPLARRG